jgi:hypothetical protein
LKQKHLLRSALLIVTLLAAPPATLRAGEGAATWTMLAGSPKDLVGREMPVGADAAWCYVPELKGFLCYGGFTPRYTNAGWLFDPVRREWKLLWADDAMRYETETGKWRALMPREMTWSRDRPGMARGQGIVYSQHTKKVYIFGGHPQHSKHAVRNRDVWGSTKLGTWELDPTTLKFKHLTDDGPGGLTRGVYDSASKLIVAVPDRPYGRKPSKTWVFSITTGKWQGRTPNPSPRPGPHPAFSYDSKAKKCVYFSEYGETWTFDATANQWKNMKPAKAPPPRRHAGMCFDSRRGVSVLHGGIRNGAKLRFWHHSSSTSFLNRPDRPDYSGTQYTDTWTYNLEKNLWTELKLPAAPPKTSSIRDNLAYDPDKGACVLYDIAIGFWSFGAANAYGKEKKAAVKTVIGPELLAIQKQLALSPPPLGERTRAWQDGIRKLADDSFLVTKATGYGRGDVGIVYDSKNRCVLWIAGCLDGHQPVYEDSHFPNTVMMLDMDVGQTFMRRASIPWGLATKEYARLRPRGGCMRATAFDSKRGAVWTFGGNGGRMPGTSKMNYYDVMADKFSSGKGKKPFVGNEYYGGLVYDAKNDLVVMVAGSGSAIATAIFDPAKNSWRKAAAHAPKTNNKTNAVYDPKLGVIMIARLPVTWKPGDALPRDWKKTWPKIRPQQFSLRAYAYDAATDKWRHLAAKGIEKTRGCYDSLGIAYDSRNRAVVVIEGGGKVKRTGGKTWILDLATNSWSKGGKPPAVRGLLGGYGLAYDRNHNVFVLGSAPAVILYRYKGGCPKDAFKAKTK